MDKLEELLVVLESRYNMYKGLCNPEYVNQQDDIFEQIRNEINKIKTDNQPRRNIKHFKGNEHPHGG